MADKIRAAVAVLATLVIVTVTLVIVMGAGFSASYLFSIPAQEYLAVVQGAASSPEAQKALGSAPALVEISDGKQNVFITVSGGQASLSSGGTPDYVVSGSNPTFLSVMNAADRLSAFKGALAEKTIAINARDTAKQAAIKALLSSGLMSAPKMTGIPLGNYYRLTLPGKGEYLANSFGGTVGFLPTSFDLLSKPPARSGVFFTKPPGVLAQNPGLIYDTTTSNPNLVGPQNIFKINPGLIGPNQILKQNPGLIGPADIARLEPGLAGPAEFAYAMGIGSYSYAANGGKNSGLTLGSGMGNKNRWGQP